MNVMYIKNGLLLFQMMIKSAFDAYSPCIMYTSVNSLLLSMKVSGCSEEIRQLFYAFDSIKLKAMQHGVW